MFCKSCEPEIVLKIKTVVKIKTKNYFMFTNLTKFVNQRCHALEILKKMSIVLYSFSCTKLANMPHNV